MSSYIETNYTRNFLAKLSSKLDDFEVKYVSPTENNMVECLYVFSKGKTYKQLSEDKNILAISNAWKSNKGFGKVTLGDKQYPCLSLYRTINEAELNDSESKFEKLKIQFPFREVHQYDDYSEEYYGTGMEYFSDIAEAAEKDFKEEDLAQYLDYPLNEKVKSLTLRLKTNVQGIAEIIVLLNDNLDDDEKKLLLEDITGQLSDGWGEGFEQQEIASYTEEAEDYEYNEETDEDEPYTYDVTVNVYAQFWWSDKGSNKWYIKYV